MLPCSSHAGEPGETEFVVRAAMWGTREAKYSELASASCVSMKFAALHPTAPFYLFVPQETSLRLEFEPLPSVTEIFPANSMGITTGDDERFVGFTEKEFEAQLRIRSKLKDFAYRPFDTRLLHYDPDKLARARFDFMRSMLEHRNLALVTIRRPRNDKIANFFVSTRLTDKCFISSLDNCQVFPLLVTLKKGALSFSKDRVPNLTPSFLKRLALALNLPQKGTHGLPSSITPQVIFNYAYAAFHSPDYRIRYAEFLKIDFPRLPLTGDLELFRRLAQLGSELVAVHLLESPKLGHPITEYLGGHPPEVEKVGWTENTVWIDKAQSTGFKGVSEDVWNFHVGGYQVCEKWLKDRKGRTLSKDDIAHYQKIVVALAETIRLMKGIDEVIEKHGGWSAAFNSSAPKIARVEDHEATERAEIPSELETLVSPASGELSSHAIIPSAQTPHPPEFDVEGKICLIREVFGQGGVRDRKTAIRDIAKAMGFERAGSRISGECDDLNSHCGAPRRSDQRRGWHPPRGPQHC